MKVQRFEWDGQDPRGLAAEVRALQPALGEVSDPVAEIIAEVRAGGDAAVAEIEARFGDGPVVPDTFRQPDEAVDAAASRLDPDLVAALEAAAANIRAVAGAQLSRGPRGRAPAGTDGLSAGGPCRLGWDLRPGRGGGLPLDRADGLHPGEGRRRRASRSWPRRRTGGEVPDVILAAAAIGGADEVYAVGGAQAIAALALGTDRIAPST